MPVNRPTEKGPARKMDRREFVKLLGAGTAATAASIWTAGCGGGNRSVAADRVIVVGAGVAGLTIGNALTSAGMETLVIEARGRLGGRVWSKDVDGVTVDLGAMPGGGSAKSPFSFGASSSTPCGPVNSSE